MQEHAKRLQAAETVVRECFWGDYKLSPSDIVRRLHDDHQAFKRFIFSKIVDNSRHPSLLIRRLFEVEQARKLIRRNSASVNSRRAMRLKLVGANVLGDRTEIPEYSWRR